MVIRRSSTIQLIALVLFTLIAVRAQTTAFNYQGSLKENGSAATGAFQMQFKLFDSVSGGSQIGTTITDMAVTADQGTFSVKLDFGASALTGANRFLEIAVRRNSSESYIILTPREQIASAPYAVRTLSAASADVATNALNANVATNALNLGGQAASQFVQTNDSRLSDARVPLPGSPSYIQNSSAQQAASNFNITGNGAANIFDAASQFNIGGSRALSVQGTRNAFVGIGAGQSNVQGMDNAFFGFNAGLANTGNEVGIAGNSNTYVGSRSGESNSLGRFNSFLGAGAGRQSTGNNNSIFGAGAGEGSTTGNDNSMFGVSAGQTATTGNDNSFFGVSAGAGFTAFGDPQTPNTGSGNSFFGSHAGLKTSTAINNSFFGFNAGQSNRTAGESSYFGAFAGTNSTGGLNTFVGYNAGASNTVATQNTFVGHSSGGSNTTGTRNSFFGRISGFGTTTGSGNTFIGYFAGARNTSGDNNTVIGVNADLSASASTFETVIGSGAEGNGSNSITLGRSNRLDLVVAPGGIASQRYIRVQESSTLPAIWARNDADGPGLSASSFTGYAAEFAGTGSILVRGVIDLMTYANGGPTVVCRLGNRLANCSSSIRYKTNVVPFSGGLDFIDRLRPVSYNWKSDGASDIGFIAEEVDALDARFITHNAQGEIEGLKYDRLTTVLVNAIKEQQRQIELLQRQLEEMKQSLKTADRASEQSEEKVEEP